MVIHFQVYSPSKMATSAVVRAGVGVVVRINAETLIKMLKTKKTKKKRIWVRDWISRRNNLGASALLLTELVSEDPGSYKNFMRLSSTKFEELLSLVTPKIRKSETVMRSPIQKLNWRIPKCTISKFLPEVLLAIYEVLADYIKIPTNKEEWIDIERSFSQQWNFPHCCGAIDGKHVQIQRPSNSGSEFYNYKGTYSIILFALVDADYCFKYIEVGANGRANDSTIFRNSDLNKAMLNGSSHLPNDSVIIGDDAFPLRTNLLKPYSGTSLTVKQRIFNYRLSRARRIVENAFGILSSRFRIFRGTINLKSTLVDLVIKTCCALHNWLRITSGRVYIPQGAVDREDTAAGVVVDGSWRTEVNGPLQPIQHLGINNYSQAANQLRDQYAEYFSGEGNVPWQNRMIVL